MFYYKQFSTVLRKNAMKVKYANYRKCNCILVTHVSGVYWTTNATTTISQASFYLKTRTNKYMMIVLDSSLFSFGTYPDIWLCNLFIFHIILSHFPIAVCLLLPGRVTCAGWIRLGSGATSLLSTFAPIESARPVLGQRHIAGIWILVLVEQTTSKCNK